MTDAVAKPANTRKSRGWKRTHELRAQDAAEKARIEQGFLDSLGRPPNEIDRNHAENCAVLTVVSRVYERRGDYENALDVRRQLAIAMKASGFRPAPVTPAKPAPGQELQNIFDQIASERP